MTDMLEQFIEFPQNKKSPVYTDIDSLCKLKAAQAWCTDKTSDVEMDTNLCEAFAKILEEVLSEVRLGNATTKELLDELLTRAEIHGYANYKPFNNNENDVCW